MGILSPTPGVQGQSSQFNQPGPYNGCQGDIRHTSQRRPNLAIQSSSKMISGEFKDNSKHLIASPVPQAARVQKVNTRSQHPCPSNFPLQPSHASKGSSRLSVSGTQCTWVRVPVCVWKCVYYRRTCRLAGSLQPVCCIYAHILQYPCIYWSCELYGMTFSYSWLHLAHIG